MSAEITGRRLAGEDHQVVSVEGGTGQYRRTPCGGCPWRVDQTGEFPAEAFLHSAETAYDMSTRMFGCHESGADRPKTCAGFLLRGADHNLAVRLAASSGRLDPEAVRDGGHELHRDYRTMAVANGCEPSDPILHPCR
jgi:hypothetical protein